MLVVVVVVITIISTSIVINITSIVNILFSGTGSCLVVMPGLKLILIFMPQLASAGRHRVFLGQLTFHGCLSRNSRL